jgi:hypothetical protein
MELSPSWEGASCAITQELSNILCNPKVRYSIHNSVCKQACLGKHLKPGMTEESIDLGSYTSRDLVTEKGHLVLLGSSGKEFSLGHLREAGLR